MKMKQAKTVVAVVITNVLGGGTPRHAWEMVRAWSQQGHMVVMIQEVGRLLVVSVYGEDGCVKTIRLWEDKDLNQLVEILRSYHVSLLHIEHLLDANPAFLLLHKKLGVPFIITLHDYYTICPYIKLTNEQEEYCGEEGVAACNRCIMRRGFFSHTLGRNLKLITEWRQLWFSYLKEAAFVVVPSEDMKRRVLSYYPELTVKMVEDPELINPKIKYTVPAMRPGRKDREVGLIGNLPIAKGAEKIKECLAWCSAHKVSLHFTLFGTLSDVTLTKAEREHITILGPYQENEIYNLISKHAIDFFWFPGILPETYSYTLSIPIRLHIPCISTDLGAIASRIHIHHWGETYSWQAGPEEIVHHLLTFPYESYAGSEFTISNTTFGRFEDFYGGIPLLESNVVKAESTSLEEGRQVENNTWVYDHLPGILTRAEFNTLWPGATVHQKYKLLAHVDRGWLKTVLQKKGVGYFLRKIRDKALR